MSLVELRVSGIAVLEGVTVAPGSGFTALTGETGSGKSLCITALRLVLGRKVDATVIRASRDAAHVAAVFDDVPAAVRSRLEANGIGDDEILTLVRELPRAGRGVCRINGALVSLPTLREIGDELVEVTAQGESHRLFRPARQRALVDAAAGAEVVAARAAMAQAHQRRLDAAAALERIQGARAADAVALENAREIVASLLPLHLRPAEEPELLAERHRLRHAEGLAAALEAVHSACSDDGGAADALAAGLLACRVVQGVDAGVDSLLVTAHDELEHLRDLGSRARDLAGALDVDPRRLAAVEERLDELDRVRRRHGSITEALDNLSTAGALLDSAEGGGDALERQRQDSADAAAAAVAAAGRLSRLRRAAAARLEREVTAQLRALRLPHARFRIVLSHQAEPGGIDIDGDAVACGPEGVDVVEMRLASTRDGVPIPLDGGVSGGELSRVALALRAIVTAGDECPTLVLDEVDTGLGGETAARVGEVLAAVGQRRQVLVVTHRPEIAARASCHLRVERTDTGGDATARVDRVEDHMRAEEVARLMSGSPTAAALARAAELLAERPSSPARSGTVRTMAPS